jgi:CubicO group peptidase (beta-lactamase class C family)
VTAPFEIHGFCNERFRVIEEAFRANFEDGLEIGASLGVTWRGKMVVDLWGGWANPQKTRAWKKNTLVLVYSLTKLMVLMSVFRLVDRGQLNLDEPLCRYWPEFAQGGKDKVTLREFITHQGGVPAFVPPASFDVRLEAGDGAHRSPTASLWRTEGPLLPSGDLWLRAGRTGPAH